jgi:O-antigen chain-terminating methyltransferase
MPSSEKVARNLVEQRIRANLDYARIFETNSLAQRTPAFAASLGSIHQKGTFMQRIRRKVVLDVLPKFNLTSHKSLREAYRLLDTANRDVQHLRGEYNRTQQLLDERSEKEQQLTQQLEEASAQRKKLAKRLKRLQAQYDTLQAQLAARANSSSSPSTEPSAQIELPQTIHADIELPNQDALNSFFASHPPTNYAADSDAIYFALEASFRGTEEDIKERQAAYLPDLPFNNSHLPVIDLGCGRGEFLELLQERGIKAEGVDTNAANIARLQEKGLTATHQDALEYLEGLEPNSIAAVTAFQVVEHLPHEYLRDLLKTAFVRIAPRGFVFLETVNTFCLEIFRTYYLDPTHQNPIPPHLLTLLAQFYGFREMKIFYQSPVVPKVDDSQQDQLHLYFQNYAVLGVKPNPGS